METLITGASSATGRLLVKELLDRGETVRVIVREGSSFPEAYKNHEKLNLITGSILEQSGKELAELVSGCGSIVSCLGHNLSLRGICGHPRRLVTDATRRLCEAVRANKPGETVKFVLMNTAGNNNRDLPESISFKHRSVLGILHLLLPPQPSDNPPTLCLIPNIHSCYTFILLEVRKNQR